MRERDTDPERERDPERAQREGGESSLSERAETQREEKGGGKITSSEEMTTREEGAMDHRFREVRHGRSRSQSSTVFHCRTAAPAREDDHDEGGLRRI